MATEQLVRHIRSQPFRKFRIHLADGRHVDVKHPDFIARSPGGRTAVIYTGTDTAETVDLLLVTSLEVLNGHSGRARR
ncbi:MAG: hypothetical protein HZA51_14025 [Planctomycetes bacterium]|nr:hypothetical protein [Planctomycetota bacterium]